MTVRRLAMFVAAIALLSLGVPTASHAGNVVTSAGHLGFIDSAEKTIRVKDHVIQVTLRSRFYDAGGRRITLEELERQSRQKRTDVTYTAYAVGRQLLLKELRVGKGRDL